MKGYYPMTDIKTQLIERAMKRADDWQTFNIKKFPDVEKLHEIVLLGAHSFALVQTRRRLVKEKIFITPQVYETPSAIARDYLRIVHKQGPRATKSQALRVEGIEPVPSYADPQSFRHGFYIDIQAAYWSIMQISGWDVDYNPERWLSPGRPPSDFPFADHKVARNCLVSAGRMGSIDPETQKPRGIPRYDPRKLPNDPYDEIVRGSELKNNQLPRLIHDILNSIALQAVELGAVYVNNDGYIAPDHKIAYEIVQLIADWGLNGRIKAEGPGQVKASGTYQVGHVKTQTYNQVHTPMPLDNIYAPDYRKWLQDEFTFFAAKGNEL